MIAMDPQPLHARFQCTPRHATRARQAFRVYLALLHLDAKTEADLESALGEALANVIEHGYAQDTFFELRCSMESGMLTIEIEDRGRGTEIAHKLERPELSRDFGFEIMRALVDEVEFLKDGRLMRLRTKVRKPNRRPPAEEKSGATPAPTG